MTTDNPMDQPKENTDRELWREREGDYYADSLFVTKNGGIGMNVAGLCIVKPLKDWHAIAVSGDHTSVSPGKVEGWRTDIENAPKNGDGVLLFNKLWADTFGGIQIGHWGSHVNELGGWEFAEMRLDNLDEGIDTDDDLKPEDYQPTHWQPLPSPPISSRAEDS